RADQQVLRRPRLDVVKGDDLVVLVGDPGRDLAGGDAAEEAAHPRSPCAYRIAETAATLAVSAPRMPGPKLTGWMPNQRARSTSPSANPPLGPTKRLTEKGRAAPPRR